MSVLHLLFLGMLSLLVACTGQTPAGIKNSTLPAKPIKAACEGLTFEGPVFAKKNILNILNCTGWAKQYPQLTNGIANANETEMNSALRVVNESFTAKKEQRKQFFKFLVGAHQSGQMTEVSRLLEKSIGDHRLMQQLTKFLSAQMLDEQKRAALLRVLSLSNVENLRVVTAGKNFFRAYEEQEGTLARLFADEDEARLRKKVIVVLDEFAASMESPDWRQLARLIQNEGSVLQRWALRGQVADGRPLLDILEHETFVEDIAYLRRSIDVGIVCGNRADRDDFRINVAQELKHKIDTLASGTREDTERVMLHGLTKFVAFNGFCEEAQAQQGLKAFHNILTHAFGILSSESDYLFLRDMHREFGNDRFKLISFLTSKTFVELRGEFLRLRATAGDEDFVRSLFGLLGGLTADDLGAISELTKSFGDADSQAQRWFGAWSTLWRGLSFEEKDDFIHLVSRLLKQDIDLAKVMAALENLLRTFPEFSNRLGQSLQGDDYQAHLRYTIFVLSNPEVQQELARFLSGDGLFDFLELLTREGRRTNLPPVELRPELPPVVYVEPASPSRESRLTRSCFEAISGEYARDVNYYAIVNALPEACLATLGDAGFVGQIYLWMNGSNRYFEERYGVTDFHAGTGVWSPGMLQFIFTAAVKANQSVTSETGVRGIRGNVDEIHRVLTHPTLLEMFHQFSSLYGRVHSLHNFDRALLTFVEARGDDALNSLAQDVLKLSHSAPKYVDLEIAPESCRSLSRDFGADPCLNALETSEHVLTIVRLLKRKNEDGKSLIQEILRWIHPAGGVDIPYRKRSTATHKTSLDEVIRFLADLSAPKTARDFVMHGPRSEKAQKGTVIDRLEILIRDIGFLNNFYGAFYKNHVAGADNYRKTVQNSEILLHALGNVGGGFRGVDALPDDSKWRLKNVESTYSSLVELSDNYRQANGSVRTYGPFIQSLLTLIGETSARKTQNFNAYRVPRADVVEGHNGVFLTEVVRLSGLRHLGSFVRNRFGEGLAALEGKEFQLINSRLLARHELPKLQQGLQSVLDKYLDADRNQLNQLIMDVTKFSKDLSRSEQELFEEVSVKLLLLLSSTELSNRSIQDVAAILEVAIEAWPELRTVVTQVGHTEKFLGTLNRFLDQFLAHPEKLERVLSQVLNSRLLTREDFLRIVKDTELRAKLVNFILFSLESEDVNSTLNWAEVLEAILGRDEAEWEALKTWFASALGDDQRKLTLSLLVDFLGEKDDEGYRFKRMMDELFFNHRESLLQFLEETFPSLEVRKKSL